MLPYLALALYIISLITSLILMLTAKGKEGANVHRKVRGFKIAVAIHFLLLLLFMSRHLLSSTSAGFLNLSFLLYFCTGAALCGWAMRTTVPWLLKIYFLLFDASIVLFLIMPFNFSVFVLTADFKKSDEVKIPVNEHYYIMQQGTVMQQSGYPIYRVVKHHGMFNQTVQYNLNFGGVLDSVHIISIINDKSANIRAYLKNPAKPNSADSSDVEIKLQHEAKDEIQRQI